MKEFKFNSIVKFSSGILLVFLFIFYQNCKPPDDIIKDPNCLGGLDANKFYFIGTHNTDSLIEYYISDSIYALVNGLCNITFNENRTFSFDISIDCDPIDCDFDESGCDSLVCNDSQIMDGELKITGEGTWDFEQSINTYLNDDMEGTCYLRITDSSDNTLNNSEITGHMFLVCFYKSYYPTYSGLTRIYYLQIPFTINNLDVIYLNFSTWLK